MTTRAFDAVVIGAGAGGYVAAERLAQLGKRTALVEKQSLGGASLHWGCIPSKALVAAANLMEELRGASERGLSGEARCAEQCNELLDLHRLRAFKDAVLTKLARGVDKLEGAAGVEVIRGAAQFVSATAIVVEGPRFATRVEARAFVIATGSRPVVMPGFEGQDVWSPREAVELREIPRRLVVLGGGAIALEIGTAYAKLGSRVTVVADRPSILSGMDAEVAGVVQEGLHRQGVAVHLSARATGLYRGDGGLRVRFESEGSERIIPCDKVLVAVGSVPNSEGLGLEVAGVKIGDRGFVAVDDRMQTSVPGIYCIGDVAGPPPLAHKATREGEIAAEAIAGVDSRSRWVAMPNVVFTEPEIATAGLSEEEARARGRHPIVGKFAFAAVGRALAMGHPEGFVKVVADRDSKLLLGVAIVGLHACDLIAEATLALQMGATLEDVARTVHAHPTLPEAFLGACKVALASSTGP